MEVYLCGNGCDGQTVSFGGNEHTEECYRQWIELLQEESKYVAVNDPSGEVPTELSVPGE